MINKNKVLFRKHGFTIVELLVVIVIIGILAAITIVSYSGIAAKANAAALTSELDNSKKLFALYYVDHGVYPTGLDSNNCPTGSTAPSPDTRYCLKSGSGNAFAIPTSDGLSYALTASKSGLVYEVTDSQPPFNVTPTPITAIAAITGTTQISQTLTAGALTPSGAAATYQWQSATTSGGTYTSIPGATSSTYTVSPNVMNKYIKVVATGTGIYTGTQTSTATGSAIATDSNWLTVGTQTWAKANLNVGTMVTGVTNQTNNSTLEKYCYGDSAANCTTYGGFYQWDEAMQYTNTESTQGICPAGSHIPSDNDWKILEMQLGMTQPQADATGWRGTDQGTQLKSGGSSGLNMPLAGYRYTDGSFHPLSSYANLWSSSESSTSAWRRGLDSGNATVDRNADDEALGFSVRCLGN